jgi:hypothetical protein
VSIGIGDTFAQGTITVTAWATPSSYICRCDCLRCQGLTFEVPGTWLPLLQTCATVLGYSVWWQNGQRRVCTEWLTWYVTIRRCHVAKEKDYDLYGGRGVQVCQRWRDSYLDFVRDMGPRPSERHVLTRTDPQGDFEPTNCSWSLTHRRTSFRFFDYMGERRTLTEWAQHFGIDRELAADRLRHGWTFERAMTAPLRGK